MKDPIKLGTFPTESKRDAIHIAVIAVEAGEKLSPGQSVGIQYGQAYGAQSDLESVGVVDPFLANPIRCGTQFWLLINPGTATDLRHMWSHPMFPEPEPDTYQEEDDYDGCRGC